MGVDKSRTIPNGNGHVEALSKVMSDFQIADEEKTVGFILSVMRDADGKPIQTVKGSFVPSDKIKKPTNTEEHAIAK